MTATKKILILPGDGIGPEVVRQARRVLEAVMHPHGAIEIIEREFGGVAIEKTGTPLPDETLAIAKKADAILLGAIGGPQWDHLAMTQRPEQGLLTLRRELGLFANLRPLRVFSGAVTASPFKPDHVRGVDFVIVRELSGGLYYGEPRGMTNDHAVNTLPYSRSEIERVAHTAFRIARKRKKMVHSVDKANVLETSRLWRRIVQEMRDRDYPDVTLEHLYIDNAALQMITQPRRFDVMLTENLFGDILSDEAGGLCGSIGLLPSASLGTGPALYEPVHGSAPNIAGQNIANPIGAILSVAMLLEHSFNLMPQAQAIERAVERVISENPPSQTDLIGDAVVHALQN